MKKIVWIVGMVVAFLLVVAVLIPAVVDVNKFKPEIEARLERATGRKFSLGTLNLSLTPPLTVKASDVRVEDSSLPAGKHLLVSPSLEVRIVPWSYFRGQVEVHSLTLDSPTITLGPKARKELSGDAPQPVSARREVSTPVKVGKIQLNHLSVSMLGEEGDDATPEWKMENLEVSIPSFDSSQPLNPFTTEATIDLAGATLTAQLLRVPIQFAAGAVEVANNRFSLEKLQAALGGTKVDGQISGGPLGKPSITFQLHFPELNVEKCQEWLGPRKSPGSQAGPPGRAVSESGAGNLKLEGSVNIDRLLFASQEATRVNAQVRFEGGVLHIERFQGQFHDGTLEVGGKIDFAGREPAYELTSRLRKVNLSKLLVDRRQKRELIAGYLDLDADMAGSGMAFNDERGYRNLKARGRFSVGEGSIKTLNLLEKVRFLSVIPFLKVTEGSHTPFSYIGSDFRFDGQRIETNRMEMRTGPLNLILSGFFTLKGELDYLASAGGESSAPSDSLVGAILGAVTRNVNISFRIRGSLANPEISSVQR